MNPRVVQLVAVVLAAALLAAAATQVAPINQARVDHRFTFTGDLATNAAPDVNLMLTVGGPLRSLLVHVLWSRANRLKDEGKFYEANELASLICDLQPRFPDVWKFHAWNMAFNISVATHTPQERWAWINRAISLLRDQGIPRNPQSVKLYHELGWTFYFKIGDFMDDFHKSYKKRWARLMDTVLGPPPGGTTAETLAAFRAMATTPPTLEQLRSAEPATGPAIDALLATGLPPDLRLLQALLRLRQWRYAEQVGDPALMKQLKLSPDMKALRDWEENPAFADTAPRVLNSIRCRVLAEVYALDPVRMLALMEKFNAPFDWRLPGPHAIYWTQRGLEMGVKFGGNSEFDLLNTDRLTVIILRQLLSRGLLVYQPLTDNPENDYYLALSDWRYAEPTDQAYRALADNWHAYDPTQTKTIGIRAGHENFLGEAIEVLYMAGQTAKAQALYDQLRDQAREGDGSIKKLYQLTLADFVATSIAQNTDNYQQVIRGVVSYLQRGFVYLSAGQGDIAARYLAGSRTIYERYMADKRTDPNDRRQLPPYREIFQSTAELFLRDPSQGLADIVGRQRFWLALDLPTRQALYDRLRGFFRHWAEHVGMDPAKVFPEPAGMAEYRAAHPPAAETQPAP